MNKQAFLIAGMAFLGGLAASMIGVKVRGANADVPAVAERLNYSGVLMQGASPLGGTHRLRIRFFDSVLGGMALNCSPADQTFDLTKTAGRFRINVSACASALESAQNAFVEIVVDPATANEQMFPPPGEPRPRVGAVPFAAQAIESVTAASVTGNVPATQVTSGATTAEARLNDLATRVAALEGKVRPSVFCGETSQTFSGDLGGYAGADAKCRTLAAGCGGSATAHMCTSREMIDSVRLGVVPPVSDLWVSGGTGIFQGDVGGDGTPGNTSQVLDCLGWTVGTDNRIVGNTWSTNNATQSFPAQGICAPPAAQLKIACCDLQ